MGREGLHSRGFDPARKIITPHTTLRVPGIRAVVSFNGSEGVSWRGARSEFMVKLYDKNRGFHVAGTTLRAEVGLRGNQLRRRLKGDWRDFQALYHAFRKTLVSIPPIQKPSSAPNWRVAVGHQPADVRAQIMAELCEVPRRTRQRWLKEIESAAADLPEEFSWAALLPENRPPLAVEVLPGRLGRQSPEMAPGSRSTLQNVS